MEAGRFVTSTQVLQEFYVAATRKLSVPLAAEEAEEAVTALAELPVTSQFLKFLPSLRSLR